MFLVEYHRVLWAVSAQKSVTAIFRSLQMAALHAETEPLPSSGDDTAETEPGSGAARPGSGMFSRERIRERFLTTQDSENRIIFQRVGESFHSLFRGGPLRKFLNHWEFVHSGKLGYQLVHRLGIFFLQDVIEVQIIIDSPNKETGKSVCTPLLTVPTLLRLEVFSVALSSFRRIVPS